MPSVRVGFVIKKGRHLCDDHGVFVKCTLHELFFIIGNVVPFRKALLKRAVACNIQWRHIRCFENGDRFADGLGLVHT